MICDRCGKNKANSYKKITENGQDKFLHLCESCAKNLQSTSFKNFSVGEKFHAKGQSETKIETKVCPVCFSSFASILKDGKFGCSTCYDIFKDEFKSSILNVQDGESHVGKRGRE